MLSTDPPLASADDLDLPRVVADADEAIAVIRDCQAGWMENTGQRPA
jgi:hypothetical protein